MVVETEVLLRIEDLEQGSRGIAAKIHAHLVDLVQTKDRIVDPRLLERLDDLAGQRPDVGSPMAANLRLVAHSAQRDADEFAARGPGDRFGQRGLPPPAAHEAQDRSAHLIHQAWTARYSMIRSLGFSSP